MRLVSQSFASRIRDPSISFVLEVTSAYCQTHFTEASTVWVPLALLLTPSASSRGCKALGEGSSQSRGGEDITEQVGSKAWKADPDGCQCPSKTSVLLRFHLCHAECYRSSVLRYGAVLKSRCGHTRNTLSSHAAARVGSEDIDSP